MPKDENKVLFPRFAAGIVTTALRNTPVLLPAFRGTCAMERRYGRSGAVTVRPGAEAQCLSRSSGRELGAQAAQAYSPCVRA